MHSLFNKEKPAPSGDRLFVAIKKRECKMHSLFFIDKNLKI